MSKRDAVSWVEEYIATHPDSSVMDVAREAEHSGNGLPMEKIQALRQAWRKKLVDLNVRVEVPPSAPLTAKLRLPNCLRCGSDKHWASQCEAAIPGRVLQAVVEPDPPKPEPAMEEEKPVPSAMKLIPKPLAEIVANRMLRRQRLNELLDTDPGADPTVLQGKIKEEFKIGLAWDYIYATCRIARELHRLPQISSVDEHDRRSAVQNRLPTYVSSEESEVLTPEEELEWLARQAADIMRAHGLTDVTLEVAGKKASWSYVVRRGAAGVLNV